jgi:hypothetical protein
MNTLSAKLQELAAVRKVLQDKAGRLEKEKEKLKAETEFTKKVQALMQECGNLTLSMISMKISDIVTRAIKSIFPDPYEFQLEFDIKYGRLSAQMVLLRDKQVYYPADDNGDGVLDIIALALRTAVLCLDKRNLRRVMILDEPCGALSVDMQPLAGKLLRHLHESLGIQFIIIGAHGNAYMDYADKIFNSETFKKPGEVI